VPRNPPRQKRGRGKSIRNIAIIVAIVPIAAFVGLLVTHWAFRPKPQQKVLQAALAEQFGSEKSAIIVNIPARSGRYPGAVLAISANGSELLIKKIDRPDTVPGPSASLKDVQLSEASAMWQLAGRIFGGQVEGTGTVAIEIDLADLRMYEQEASKLAAALRADDDVNRARSSGLPIVVVTKAYEAVPELTIRQRANAKAEDWAKLKGELTNAKGELVTDSEVRFRSEQPQVIAYETSEAKFIASNFSNGTPNVELKRRLAAKETVAAPRPEDFGAQAAGEGVAFSTIASPTYSNQMFGDLPAATASIALVREVFLAAGAKLLDLGRDNSSQLTAEGFAAAIQRLIATVKEKKPRAFVLYYSGHAVAGLAGAQYLVMGDYRGKLSEDLKQTSPMPPAQQAHQPTSGSNLAEISKAVTAAAQEGAPSKPGLVSVAEVYRRLSAAEVPFAFLVDGCYEVKALDAVRNELRLTPWGDYYGTDENGGPREIEQYQGELKTYGEAPYLRSTNPVILSARPGSFAAVVRHPFFDSDLVPGVAPLAAKLAGAYQYALENRDDLPLGIWLRRITDFASTGELDVRGSISWSNFEALRAIPMVHIAQGEPE
jgi:hypothetical protein